MTPSVTTIDDIIAREILDSRGNPTVEVDVYLKDGTFGRAAVPSGASTGAHEAAELRDGDKGRYGGKGVLKARAKRQRDYRAGTARYACARTGRHRRTADRAWTAPRTNPNWARTRSWVFRWRSPKPPRRPSSCPCTATSAARRRRQLPVPMMNILNGGKHADYNVDFQEFMAMPVGAKSFSEALQMGTEIFHSLRGVLKGMGLNTAVGDEGGFAPNLPSTPAAIETILTAIDKAGFKAGEQVMIAMDAAAIRTVRKRQVRLQGRRRDAHERRNGRVLVGYRPAISAHFARRPAPTKTTGRRGKP